MMPDNIKILSIVIFCLYTLWGAFAIFKDNDGATFRVWKLCLGGFMFVALGTIALALNEPEETAPTNTDPIYQVNLNGSAPQIVKQYQEGDDIRPNLHTVYYYPELDQYEVVIIMGRDR